MPTWKDDLKKPANVIGIGFGVLGLIGTIYGVIAYYDAHKVEELSFLRNVVRVIDNSSTPSAIKIIDNNNTLIKEDVYVAVLTMWNSGNVNIEPGKIRKPMRFVLAGDGRILDTSIVKQNKDGIGDFALRPDDANKALSLSWKYFDKGMGYTAKIIYTGNDRTQLTLDEGYVDDLGPLLNVGESLERTRRFLRYQISGMIALMIVMLVWLVVRQLLRRHGLSAKEWVTAFRESPFELMNLVMIITILVTTLVFSYTIFNKRDFFPVPAIARELDFSSMEGR
jgi:hypothetical protein